jgi:hypothetical protein
LDVEGHTLAKQDLSGPPHAVGDNCALSFSFEISDPGPFRFAIVRHVPGHPQMRTKDLYSLDTITSSDGAFTLVYLQDFA